MKESKLVNNKSLQFVASILKDKLPEELNREEFFVVKLSQGDKLFRNGGAGRGNSVCRAARFPL